MEKSHFETLDKVENVHWWFEAKRVLTTEFIPRQATKILDIGSGTGAYVAYLRKLGYEASGIEPSNYGLNLARKRSLPVIYGTSQNIPANDNEYDCVTCIDVLYHKNVEVDKSLKEMLRVLKTGGTLVVFDCAYDWMRGPHDLEVHARERFSKAKLVKHVERANGKVLYVSYYYFLLFPMILVSRLLEKLTGHHKPITIPSRALNILFTWVMKIERILMKVISCPWGSSIIVVARK